MSFVTNRGRFCMIHIRHLMRPNLDIQDYLLRFRWILDSIVANKMHQLSFENTYRTGYNFYSQHCHADDVDRNHKNVLHLVKLLDTYNVTNIRHITCIQDVFLYIVNQEMNHKKPRFLTQKITDMHNKVTLLQELYASTTPQLPPQLWNAISRHIKIESIQGITKSPNNVANQFCRH